MNMSAKINNVAIVDMSFLSESPHFTPATSTATMDARQYLSLTYKVMQTVFTCMSNLKLAVEFNEMHLFV